MPYFVVMLSRCVFFFTGSSIVKTSKTTNDQHHLFCRKNTRYRLCKIVLLTLALSPRGVTDLYLSRGLHKSCSTAIKVSHAACKCECRPYSLSHIRGVLLIGLTKAQAYRKHETLHGHPSPPTHPPHPPSFIISVLG